MRLFLLTFFLLLNTILSANTIELDGEKQLYEVLSKSKVFIDKTQKLTINDIKNKRFEKNSKKLLGFGYSPNFSVWIKFTLKNNTNRTLHKILEYDNALATDILLFENSKLLKIEGLSHLSNNRKSINPIFHIQIKPHETKTYYLKSSSYITTLIIKLNLWNNSKFYEEEIKHQVILALFFGAMSILAFYNLFIFFFTKDRSYLYYVLYIFGIMIHHLMYAGVTNVYILPHTWVMPFIQYATFIVGVPALALALFTKSFLRTKQYPIINNILNIYLVLFPFLLTIFILTDEFNKYRNIFSVILLIYLVFITIYAAIKKNRQAYFVLFGWFIFLTAGMFMYLSSVGIFNIFINFPYYIEISLVVEAIIFSIALADRIRKLQKEKQEANKKLILQQKNEQKRLKEKVNEKTYDLKKALDEKGLLLKELNHRVKNNMQTIVSLIRLQSDEIEDKRLKDVLTTIQNRINAMGHLHELLYKQDNISNIDTKKYFTLLIDEVKQSYSNQIIINLVVKANLNTNQAIYCGLILNELITNSFKHAFEKNFGKINIVLTKKKDIFNLLVEDNGKGYDTKKTHNSLGLMLVDTLVHNQLKGQLKIDSTNKVLVDIKWRDDA
ncbi:histidine kinase [Malaciobacter halophilus]|uniref:histidine kinase n=1 Tax=Malaciobacter halophilus TaxID=197482 RepID=A0A2N1J418_9BACT|nr:7TM diverse intracellular signaling domain-containing protein [Malaciobacter halophilus]AXH10270.1 7TMR-DISM-7TM/7TMR-DISMED2 domain-containing two-component system sensor histidine kinase [Malaciobacter halophilus]PKI81296.1 histidine kinase [Malaciobacter halophilus]